MKSISAEERGRRLVDCRFEAIHFEMRDIYATDVERGRFAEWRRGELVCSDVEPEWVQSWSELMIRLQGNGCSVRRLRIISEPVTEYIRFEWLDTAYLVHLGEDVRWLPHRKASTLFLPGNDFWLFDRETIVFTHFSGDGHVVDREMTSDPDLVKSCVASFEDAWKIGTPHAEYRPS